ncbi:MAG: hypothetical protein ACI3ZN_09295 [Candidatus Cryptobacteroides sp.]
MKRLFILFAVILPMTVSCDLLSNLKNDDDDELIIDWYPVNIRIQVVDADGKSLLDPENPANILKGVTATFLGETYPVDTSKYNEWKNKKDAVVTKGWNVGTKAYLATFYGVLLLNEQMFAYGNSQAGNEFYLNIGEIDGAEDMDEDIVINWSDGTSDTIHYHCSDHNYKKATCKRIFALNGKEVSSDIFIFTK